jgi:hypothetical protein
MASVTYHLPQKLTCISPILAILSQMPLLSKKLANLTSELGLCQARSYQRFFSEKDIQEMPFQFQDWQKGRDKSNNSKRRKGFFFFSFPFS